MKNQAGEHDFRVAVSLPVPLDVVRPILACGFITIPHDLQGIPDYVEGMPLPVLDVYCEKCRVSYEDAILYHPICPADNPTTRTHLRGGRRERAPRIRPAPGTTAAEVAARQQHQHALRTGARLTLQREDVAGMQRSRIQGLV